MNVWNACGIRDYEVIPEHDGIGLYRVGAHGVEQEMYFLIKQEYSDWNTYLIQRGKQYKRYTAPSFEIAQISVCLFFIKYFMFRSHAFQWAETDELIRTGNLSEAINRLNNEMGLGENHRISLREGAEQYRIAIQIENREEELISCPNAFEALRAYRYYSLLLQYLNAVIDRMIPEFPQLTNERERLCEMAMR